MLPPAPGQRSFHPIDVARDFAARPGPWGTARLRTDPLIEPLRTHPKFRELVGAPTG